LAQDFVLALWSTQFGGHVLLAFFRRMLDLMQAVLVEPMTKSG
jgi:hypothetical protein